MVDDVFGRLSARVESGKPSYLRTRLGNTGSANDSYAISSGRNKRVRISAERARSIGDRLTDHDREVLHILDTVHIGTGSQLRQLLWGEGISAERQSRRQLAKLSNLRVVARLDRHIGGVRAGSDGFTYKLDVAGQHLVGAAQRRRRPTSPTASFVEHGVAVGDCYVLMRQLDATGDIELIHFETEPACWRGFSGPSGARLVLKPDAFAVTGIGDYEDRWFIEVDRATEHPGRVKKKAQLYVRYWQSGREEYVEGVFPRVLWVVPDERRMAQLVDVFGELPADQWRLFQVCTAENFPGTIIGGADQIGTSESANDERSNE